MRYLDHSSSDSPTFLFIPLEFGADGPFTPLVEYQMESWLTFHGKISFLYPTWLDFLKQLIKHKTKVGVVCHQIIIFCTATRFWVPKWTKRKA